MGIFQNSVLRNTKQDEALIAKRWANFQDYLAKTEAIKGFKEEIYQDGFLHDVFEKCLGYTLKTTNPSNYSLDREQKNETDSKKADAAIIVDGKVAGVIELKDQKSKNLDAIEAQAFGYHASHANSRYIIISNFDELRFYIDKKTAYEKFNLFNLDYEGFKKLHLILSYESISSGLTHRLLEQSNRFEVDISKQLYRDFSDFRTHLFENIVKNNYVGVSESESVSGGVSVSVGEDTQTQTQTHTLPDKPTLLRLTQKLCDRLVFILFAEDRGLLRPNTVKEIREEFRNQKFTSYTLYDIYKFYFDAISEGNDRLDIPKYNGGLFAKDELLDGLKIDDEYIDLKAQKLSDYDFMSDIGVNILGHIFEQSLTDLEEMEKSFGSEALASQIISGVKTPPPMSKRKKDGIFYTPEYITRYIVENTLGKLCSDKKAEIFGSGTLVPPINPKKLTKEEKETLTKLYEYRNFLLNLKILDPACGSGAFLNQALEFLIREHKSIDEYRRAYENESLSLYDIETNILEHNLYGVDINEDAVEIAKLSLWLRTAQKGRSLTNLSNKIVCANSLLEMPFITGSEALASPQENAGLTPRFRIEGGFDVVIGNPPYVRQEAIKEQKEALSQKYEVYSGTADLFVYFYELGIRLLKPNGLMGFICSNKFFRAKYGENLRKYILEHTAIEEIADFNGVKVFEDAAVDSAITIFRKAKADKDHKFKVVAPCEIMDCHGQSPRSDKGAVIATTSLRGGKQSTNTMKQSDLSIASFTFSNPAELIIKKKIEEVGTPLKEWDININYGIKTGFNEAFIIDTAKRDELIAKDPKSTEIIKPILRGRDIKRYGYEFANLYIIATFPALKLNIDDYPAVKDYLLSFGDRLNQNGKKGSRKKTGNKWFETQDQIAYWQEFEKEKIVYPETTQFPDVFIIDSKKYFIDKTCFMIIGNNLKYINALLNSKVLISYMKQTIRQVGIGFQLSKIFVELLPIPKITEAEQQPFIELVDEILEAKEKIKKYKKHFDTLNAVDKIEITEEIEKLENIVTTNENTIDQMVYKLYGLTSDEIAVVEGKV